MKIKDKIRRSTLIDLVTMILTGSCSRNLHLRISGIYSRISKFCITHLKSKVAVQIIILLGPLSDGTECFEGGDLLALDRVQEGDTQTRSTDSKHSALLWHWRRASERECATLERGKSGLKMVSVPSRLQLDDSGRRGTVM
ncbi:hypothetical protein CPB84DRAFT_1758702 [Gymnopilus junonius]|uniref:Uncharacterized protein n=1 Tax=Gymnopilus junonius TaxID=109634 RepID=A0A9P5TW08_GYMJU|nr:hypothetical protein CPB84DRAFT_1758702 [Gymnopilus junonius]